MIGSIILKTENLSKSFGKRKVLENINLNIRSGEIFGIIGSTGVGKTTLLECMIGFLHPDKGKILFRPETLIGKELSYKSVIGENNIFKRIFGFATQNTSFYKDLTIEENLYYFGSLYGLSKEILNQNITHVLRLVGLENERKTLASDLSGGMQKRLDIGCSIMHNPQILFLDEPTADLDIISIKKIWSLIKKINAKGTTVIIASHFLREIEHLCTRIAILNNKNIISIGTPKEIVEKYEKTYEIIVNTYPGDYDKMMKKLIRDIGKTNIARYKIHNGELRIFTKKAEPTLHKLIDIIEKMDEKILHINLNKPTLTEIFEKLISKQYKQ